MSKLVTGNGEGEVKYDLGMSFTGKQEHPGGAGSGRSNEFCLDTLSSF